jgi:hypothetical protein
MGVLAIARSRRRKGLQTALGQGGQAPSSKTSQLLAAGPNRIIFVERCASPPPRRRYSSNRVPAGTPPARRLPPALSVCPYPARRGIRSPRASSTHGVHPACARIFSASSQRRDLLWRAKPLINRQKGSAARVLLGSVADPRYHIKQRGPSGAVLFSGARCAQYSTRWSPAAISHVLWHLSAVNSWLRPAD